MNQFNAVVQVEKSHYDLRSEVSFSNLFNQIDDILFLIKQNKILTPKILIIGVGDNLLKIFLENKFGYRVKTIDIDPDLGTDYVGSVDCIDSIVKEDFDIVVCTHVLEHLPYERFEQSLEKIRSITHFALVYLPIAQFGFRFKWELFPLFVGKFNFLSTWFFKKHVFDGQHYWEIGTRGFPLYFVREKINNYFEIEKEYNAKNWLYSYNFVLKSVK